MNRAFYLLGGFIGRHPRSVLAAWALPIALGTWGGGKFYVVAQSGTSGLYGSPSNAVTLALRSEFSNPFLSRSSWRYRARACALRAAINRSCWSG